jgi:hypothetical protein
MATKTRVKTTARAKKTPARKAAAKPRVRATGTKSKKVDAAAATAAAAVPSGPRRTVFIDVENTSSESELARVLDELNIDLATGTTEVTAIGNWRVVGQQLGRSLAQRGAHLVHSAPATRVPDWSDLWIAVQAGIWLGRSRPGDCIDIVSHDRAFDAVGDAAARLGVVFKRITYRSAGAHHATVSERASEPAGERRGGRRRRRRGGSGRSGTGATAPAAPARTAHVAPPRPAAGAVEAEPHGASQEQLQQVIARLAEADPARTVTLDALTVALKAAGFQRPPGSPRLVTRLRRMKDVEVLPNGRVRINPDVEASAASDESEPLADAAATVDDGLVESEGEGESVENGAAVEGAVKRRSRRRGGRRRGGRGRKSGGTAPAPPAE